MNFNKLVLPKHIKRQLDQDSKESSIVTRFPPEPSGYLHLGHIFALKLNQSVSTYYGGKLLIRFDDTNPKSESTEYEKAILQDLIDIGVDISNLSYVSDNFDLLLDKATLLVESGFAYVDFSSQEEMAEQRKTFTASPARLNDIETNMKLWKIMITNFHNDGVCGCLRLKAYPDSKNSAMRDPVIYRKVLQHHHRTLDRYIVYPTYDFACPILDSIDGVTHVFRSKEYTERNEQMEFILSKLNMRIPKVITYGRLSIEGAELSKRKIKEGIESGLYSGWNDKKLFTYRGMKKRGITLEGIDTFLNDIGFPENMITVQQDKLFSINKKIIDKIATRIVALPTNSVKVNVVLSDIDTKSNEDTKNNDATILKTKTIPCFIRNPDLGTKEVTLTNQIFISKEDFDMLNDGDEICLHCFGNAIYKQSDNTLISNFTGNIKTALRSILWLPNYVNLCSHAIVTLPDGTLNDYLVENHILKLKENSFVQLYKMNYYTNYKINVAENTVYLDELC